MKSLNKDKKSVSRRIVKRKNLKRVIIAITLALIGLVVYIYAYQYTYQEKQRKQLEHALQEKVQLQKELDKKQLDSQETQKQIEQLKKELQAKRDNQARALAEAEEQKKAAVTHVQAPQQVYSLPANQAKAFIYQHESGNNPAAVNSIGCRGLGQACPGSKLPCSDSDYACQDAWFTNYAMTRYGSWEAAYQFWIGHRWW